MNQMAEEEYPSVLRYSLIIIALIFSIVVGQDNIIFPHNFHIEDQEIECSECHDGIETSSTVASRFLPTMDTCGDCHDVDDGDCSQCHAEEDDPLPLTESLATSGMKFPHVRHLKVFSDCLKCHDHIMEDDGEEIFPVWDKKDCAECHQQTRPKSHEDSWISDHGLTVNDFSLDGCNQCHTSSTCDQCHEYQQIEPKVHPGDFIYNHGFDFRAGVMECTTCHDIARDCQTCHKQNNVWPVSHNQADWSNFISGDGGLHGEAAESEPEVCQACHQFESTNSCMNSGCHQS